MNISSEEEFKAFFQELVQQFHPQAEIIGYSDTELHLKSPEPMTKDQVTAIWSALNDHELVREAGLIFYDAPGYPTTRKVSTRKIAVDYLSNYTEDQIREIEAEFGLVQVRADKLGFIYQAGENPLESIEIANRLHESGHVEYAQPAWWMKYKLQSHAPDELFQQGEQWYLVNTGQDGGTPGEDINILTAWDTSKGASSVIGIIDTGVDHDEEYAEEAHGTHVAGLATARGFDEENTKGICGVAPHARFAALRLDKTPFGKEYTDWPDALIWENDAIDVYNNSWTIARYPGYELAPLLKKMETSLKEGVGVDDRGIDVQGQGGRHGKGNIYVIAAGNENNNSNYDGFVNSRLTIPVAASNRWGTKSGYSDRGAHILVNAPSNNSGYEGGILTTDYSSIYNLWRTYTDNFGGTSAAAPLVSGVIALMLDVNPDLTWRDVQHILIETATKNDNDDESWDVKGIYPFSHKYGFGRINAAEAVNAAESWLPVLPEVSPGPKGSQTELIDFSDNIRIEFVEVTFTSPYNPWYYLNVILTSPIGTKSVLAEVPSLISSNDPIEFYETTYENWRFGSIRHFGESSQGRWELTATDLDGDPVEFTWTIRFYGTELPTYVKAVEARSGDDLIYHAEWIKEEDGQLEYVESVEPQYLSNTTPLHLTMVTSEAMQWLSLNLFDQDFSSNSPDPARTIQQADDSGTRWEVTIDPSNFPQDNDGEISNVYTLTITGQDSGDLYLLPFADRYPKTLPTHPSDADWPDQPNAGDTVHQIGKILSEPFEWRITMPSPGDCDYDIDHGGIVCTFDGEKNRVTFSPKDVDVIKANVQYVMIGSVGQESSIWEGTYQVPTEGSGDLAFGVEWGPQEAWFPFREPSPDQQELWCAENPPDYKPNEPKGPPASDTDTAPLPWTISAQPNPDPATESCQIRVTWEAADVEEEARTLIIDLQPQSLCEAFQNQSGTVEATATYPWDVVDRLAYTGCHLVDEETEILEHIMENGTRKYWPISDNEKVLEPGQCRSRFKKEFMFRFLPEKWPSQPPQDIPFPTSPEEGDIAIHYECQWYEDVIANPFLLVYTTHWTWTYRCPTVYVEGEGRQTSLGGGWDCHETITHLTWECGDKCTYQELPGEFVPPVPVLERELTLPP